MRFLFIGDIHIKHANLSEISIVVDSIKSQTDVDYIVFAGDILDTHERVDVQLLNVAYDMINVSRNVTKTFVIVGNHDMINNQQFLTDAHWMNGMKEWNNVTVVDKPTVISKENQRVILCPYVFPGRFIEALNNIDDWKNADLIFAHQEFKGCKMGAIISQIGDDWDINWPIVISGHIHERQTPQENIIYPGSILMHSFGSSKPHGFSNFTLDKDGTIYEKQISLQLVRKKIITKNIGDVINKSELKSSNKFNMIGTIEEISAFKKSI
jgi:DNA repair exonuclease SbcCD nuclease subunit